VHWPNSPIRHVRRVRGSNGSPSFSANLRGGVAFAGNTLLTCPENVSARKRHRAKRGRRGTEPCRDLNNNDHNMVYTNVDSGGGRFDSSSATLTVPTGARVVKAFLYWGADLSEGVKRPTPNGPDDAAPGGADPQTNTHWKIADLRVGSGSYTKIDAGVPAREGEWKGVPSWYNQPGQDPGFAYQVRADVTAEVNAGLTATRRRARAARVDPVTVTVANVQAGKGYNRHGGWNLLVVWQSPTAAFRDITIFDGFDFVQVQGGQQLVVGPLNFTGFSTPASGKVDAHVTTWTYEGDRGITGDYMAVGNVSSTCDTQTHLDDALHHVGNFFNSAISRGGVDAGDRNPDYSNQMGFDLATVNVPEGTIGNAKDGASVCLGTVGDTYFFGGIVFDTLIRAPNVDITKDVDRSSAGPGDTVTYTTTVTNPQRNTNDPLYPTAAATNLVVSDPLPSGIEFGAFTVNPQRVCSYTTASRIINCDVGTLPAGGSFTYSFTATVSATAEGPAPNPVVNTGCFRSNSEDQPDVFFTGCDDAPFIVPPQPPPQPKPADLGVVKTVSSHTVAPGDTVTWKLVGTNYGPATSTHFVLADQLPPGVSFVSASASAALTCTTPPVGSSGAVTCTAPSVPVKPADGSSLTVTIVATVPAGTANGTLLLNIATVNGDQDEPAPDPHPNRDETITRVVVPDQPIPPPPDPLPPSPSGPSALSVPQPPQPLNPKVLSARLRLHKQATPRRVRAGAAVTFALRVRNPTEISALRVRVCDALPRGLSVASAPGFKVRGRTVCKSIGTLKVRAAKTLRFSVRVGRGAPSRITNVATADGSNTRSARARARIRVLPSVTG
jgi:large repetitive protein